MPIRITRTDQNMYRNPVTMPRKIDKSLTGLKSYENIDKPSFFKKTFKYLRSIYYNLRPIPKYVKK